ncbi:MAG: hypothetical protein KF788_22445 [Piscinibacter sp.]|nr:hypothetical protein [Piscinibacter sp.]
MSASHAPFPWRGSDVFAALFITALALGVLWPLRHAGYQDDDWIWLALAKHLDNPLPAFWNNVLWGYFWRPLPLLSDWLAARLFDTAALPRYVFSAVQHASNALLGAALVAQATRQRLPALAAGLLIATLPAVAGLALWLSNRNELLALNFGLAALFWLERMLADQRGVTAWRALVLALALFLALASKESAYVVALALGLRTLFAIPRLSLGQFLRLVLALGVPVGLALLGRAATVGEFAGTLGGDDRFAVARQGIVAWFSLLPHALAGFHEAPWRGLATAAVFALLMLALGRRRKASSTDLARPALLATGVVLLIVPALVQWPVTGHVLPHAEAIQHIVNLRFFALASVGAALIAAGAAALTGWRIPAFVALLLLIATGTLASHGQSSNWARHSGWTNARLAASAQAAVTELDALPAPAASSCTLDLHGPNIAIPYWDSILKAHLPRDSPWLGCTVFVDGQAPYHGIAPASVCRNADTAPAVQNSAVIVFGGLCQRIYTLPDNTRNDTRLIRIDLP